MSVLWIAPALALTVGGSLLAMQGEDDPETLHEHPTGLTWLCWLVAFGMLRAAFAPVVAWAISIPVVLVVGWRAARILRNRQLGRELRAAAPVEPGPWPGADGAWQPIPVGSTPDGQPVTISLPANSLLVAGTPGMGKSNLLQLLTATCALDPQCRLFILDSKHVELGPWRLHAERFTSVPGEAVEVLSYVRSEMLDRYQLLASYPGIKRKITEQDGLPLLTVIVDELAGFTADAGEHGEEFNSLLGDLIRRGRAAAVVIVAATQRPTTDIISGSVRGNVGLRMGFRVADVSGTIATFGTSEPPAHLLPRTPGLAYLTSESGDCQTVQCHYLSDAELEELISRGARPRQPVS